MTLSWLTDFEVRLNAFVLVHLLTSILFTVLLVINIRDLRVQVWAEKRRYERRQASGIWVRGTVRRSATRLIRSFAGLGLGLTLWYAYYNRDVRLWSLAITDILPLVLIFCELLMFYSGLSEIHDRYRMDEFHLRNIKLWKRFRK